MLFAATPLLVLVPYPAVAGASVAGALAQLDEDRRAGARAAYDACVRDWGVEASWSEIFDMEAEAVFARQARCADLSILGQWDSTQAGTGGVQPGFPQHVLAQSGRPAVLVPYAGVQDGPLDTVLVAWKETPESARALAGALPLLQAARQVHLLAWGWEAPQVGRGSVLDPAGWLREHGVNAQWHDEGPDPGNAIGEFILNRCTDLGANLLVMGCYGRSRASEWLLGGASRTLLQSMTLPVFMSH